METIKDKLDLESFGFELKTKFGDTLPTNLMLAIKMDSNNFHKLFEDLEMYSTINDKSKINEFKYNSSSGVDFIILKG